MWTCPKCREEIADGLENCWNCGVDKSGSAITDTEKVMFRAMGRQELYVDTRKGLFFCVTSAILGGIFFFCYRPAPPSMLKDLLNNIKVIAAKNNGINEIVSGLTKAPYCYVISGALFFGLIGWIIDRVIGNGNSKLCKISHLISCSDIDKPTAMQIIVKGMGRKLVEERLGIPLQIVTRDSRELWVYKFAKVTFEKGRVSLIE